jgi:hypothetical protein
MWHKNNTIKPKRAQTHNKPVQNQQHVAKIQHQTRQTKAKTTERT